MPALSPNAELITRIYSETAKGNGRPFVEAMADTMTWRTIGTGAWSGTFSGKETIIREIFAHLRNRLEGANTCVPSRIHDAGDYVIVQARGKNRTKDGKAYENDYCFVIRVENGKMVEFEEYCDTELVTAAIGDRIA